MEQLKGISIFVEAVEAGGFSAAAERLHLTRSAVGKTIARLEQRLGVRLFNRTTRSISLIRERMTASSARPGRWSSVTAA